MKNQLIILSLLLLNLSIFAQNTNVPDDNFEQALIDLGYDTAPLDDVVLTANINTISSLNVSNRNITDLTGIEDFIDLETLDCGQNQITNLDLTQNTALVELSCYSNQLTSLDLSQNIALTNLNCLTNQLISLDLSQNIALEQLNCAGNLLTSLDFSQNIALLDLVCWNNNLTSIDISNNADLTKISASNNSISSINTSNNTNLSIIWLNQNMLTSLDLSQNAALTDLRCQFNEITSMDVSQNPNLSRASFKANNLSSLNVANGNNSNFTFFEATNNPNLTCIEVDDAVWSTANWTSIDITTSFSENCTFVGIDEFRLESISIYPNPVFTLITLKTAEQVEEIKIIDISGKPVKHILSTNNIIDVSNLTNGIYFLLLQTEKGIVRSKFIKE